MSLILSKPNKAVLVPKGGATTNMFPDAPALDDWLVVPHTIPSTIILRSLGYNIDNPLLCYYDFGYVKPFHVQRRTMDLMTTAKRCYVFNEMGTGKTKCTLWAWDYLHAHGFCGKLLVVATLSTLRFAWEA